MGTNAKKVFIARADQSSTTGALARGAVLTTIPDDITGALTAISSWTTSGYISEDGASLSTSLSTTDIREWNRAAVRRLLEEFDGTVTLTLIQMDGESAKQCFGEDNVTVTPANAEHGELIHIKLGAHLDKPRGWALRMKDGDMRMVVLVPNGQVTSGVDITFAANSAINLPITISANDDGTGESIHIFTDDGVTSA